MDRLVAVLMTDPPAMDTFNLMNCNNCEQLASEINRVFWETRGIPRIMNPSVSDPVPGFQIRYFTQTDLELDRDNSSWEIFSNELDLVTIVPLEQQQNVVPGNCQVIRLVAVLMTEPITMDICNLMTCNNFEQLAAKINRVFSETRGMPRIMNPSVSDPVPGFQIRYFTQTDVELDRENSSLEIFSNQLDLITIVPLEQQ